MNGINILNICKTGDLEALIRLKHMKYMDKYGHTEYITLFLYASRYGHLNILHYIHMLHSFVIASYHVNRAIKTAAENGHRSVVEYLLKQFTKYKNSVLIGACDGCQISLIRYALDTLGADINYMNSYALKAAVKKRDIFLYKYLLSRGAKLRPICRKILLIATRNGDLPMLKLLVNTGANMYPVKQECMNIATRRGYIHIVKWLINQVTLEN